DVGERAFQAKRHIMLQSRKINFGKLANIKVTKKDSFNNVNNWKLKKKRFCSQCGKPYSKHHPGCTRNNGTHMNGKRVERRTVPMEIKRFKKGNFSKKPYNKGKGKLYKGKFTKKKF
ncbi:7087_t:CDS:2, partial [Dentiscutata heterogama]